MTGTLAGNSLTKGGLVSQNGCTGGRLAFHIAGRALPHFGAGEHVCLCLSAGVCAYTYCIYMQVGVQAYMRACVCVIYSLVCLYLYTHTHTHTHILTHAHTCAYTYTNKCA